MHSDNPIVRHAARHAHDLPGWARALEAFAIRYSYDEATGTVFIGSLIHGARDPAIGRDRFT